MLSRVRLATRLGDSPGWLQREGTTNSSNRLDVAVRAHHVMATGQDIPRDQAGRGGAEG